MFVEPALGLGEAAHEAVHGADAAGEVHSVMGVDENEGSGVGVGDYLETPFNLVKLILPDDELDFRSAKDGPFIVENNHDDVHYVGMSAPYGVVGDEGAQFFR